jgi:glycosyltransferase involved in cell wall biosynthesis
VKVLLYSPAFLPQIGGLELNVANLAEGLVASGYEVVVITSTPAGEEDLVPYRVVRRPGPLALLRWARWCDVFFQKNVSLRGLWPLLFVRRPWVVSHHSWYCRTDGRVAWQDRLKRRLLRFAAASISVSEAVAADLDTPSTVIHNAYRDHLFRLLPEVARDGELLFVGRLVSDKGVDLLLDALALLAERGRRPRLTIVGDGPERERLAGQAQRLGLTARIDFAGVQRGEELVRTMNRHRVLVVPSRYREPFGIVALEGMACGCMVVGSRGGGLAEAIGPGGLTFPNGDRDELAHRLAEALDATAAPSWRMSAAAVAHLDRHRSATVLAPYVATLEAVAGGAAANLRRAHWIRSSS